RSAGLPLLGTPLPGLVEVLGVLFGFLFRLAAVKAPIHADDIALGTRGRCRGLARPFDREVGALHALAGLDADEDAVALLDLRDEAARVIEDVKRDARRGEDCDGGRRSLHAVIFDPAQNRERDRLRRADYARALTMRTLRGRAFEHAGPQALARHLEEAEVRDVPDLDARAIMAQRVLEA